jgi:YD repeat-containing protein
LRAAGKLAEAIAAAEKMLAIERQLFGDRADAVVQSLEWLAQLPEQREDFTAAGKRLQEVRDIQTARYGTTPQGTTAYAYNAANQQTSMTNPLSDQTAYAYEAAGEQTSVTQPLGDATEYTYTLRGQVANESLFASAATTAYLQTFDVYNADSDLTSSAALSAFNTFCDGADKGRFPDLKNRDELWALLVVPTARKVADMLRSHRRQKHGEGMVRGDSAFHRAEDDGDLGCFDDLQGRFGCRALAWKSQPARNDLFIHG